MAHVLACLRQVAPAGNAADMAVINRQQLGLVTSGAHTEASSTNGSNVFCGWRVQLLDHG